MGAQLRRDTAENFLCDVMVRITEKGNGSYGWLIVGVKVQNFLNDTLPPSSALGHVTALSRFGPISLQSSRIALGLWTPSNFR